MKIDVLGSNSSGNCYIIEDQGQKLIVEAGVHIDNIKKNLNFDFKNVVGCLVSHEHNDHALNIEKLLYYGIDVCASEAVFKAKNVIHNRAHVVTPNKGFALGGFKIMAFKVEHDVDTFGFVIKGPSGKKILFATDTQFVLQQFKDINIYMMECNFDMDSMRKAVKCGKLDPMVLMRVAGTHMSLETLQSYFEKADLSKTEKIILIHLSERNSNESKYIDKIQNQTGIKTIAANSGIVVDLMEDAGF